MSSVSGWLGEWAAVAQVPRLLMRTPMLLTETRGRRRPVLVLPGRGVSDVSTAPLRGYLRKLGYRCHGWGLGVNDGNLDRLLPLVEPTLGELAHQHEGPVAIVGQSLGGFVAREAARAHPELVSQVITFGTPLMAPRSERSIVCPVTAIYSRRDRVVSWRHSIDPASNATNIEVASTHFGMGIDPDVWRIVARHLAVPVSAGEAVASTELG